MIKRIGCFFVLIFVAFSSFSFSYSGVCFAKNNSQEEVENELSTNVEEVIDDLDFSALDKFLNSVTSSDKIFFDAKSFTAKIKQIISGEFTDGYSSLTSALIGLFFDNLLAIVPTFSIIIAIGIISSLFTSIKGSSSSSGEIVHLCCFGVIAVIVVKYICDFVAITHSILNAISSVSTGVFPILLTLMASLGGSVSGKVYQPAVLLFTNVIIKIFSTILISLFIFSFIFNIVSSFSTRLKFKKFSEFFASTFKWILGVVFFLFMSYLALQGITASMFDGMKIRTAKFALKSYVPLLGGYLSEGFDFILSSLSLVKNAVGVAAILLILSFIISPLLKIIIFGLGLKFASAVCEPICDDKITSFLSSVAKSLSMLSTLIIGVGFMFLIIAGLITLTMGVI